MKYIRTRDGLIFTVVEKIDKTKINHSYKYLYRIKEVERSNSGGDIIVDINVVKQADTIEELCDGYIIVPNTKYGIPFTRRIEDFDFLHPLDKDITEAIYGFIKTDKGLIYVAKMNDKGELELL